MMGKENTKANYHAQVIRSYQGIPTIEALPEIMSEETVITRLTKYPEITVTDLLQPPEIRKHLILSGLSGGFYQPLNQHLEIEELISTIIRQGYMGRNPLSPESRAKENQLYLEQMGVVGVESQGASNMTALGSTILGISGVGKSSAIERILKMYPQAIHHTEYNGEEFLLDQVVWLKIDCPDDGSIKALCHQFFNAMDMALGSNYYGEYVRPRQSEQTFLTGMKRCAYKHQLGILVVDEIQHLSTAKSGGVERMLNFFVSLVNTLGLPVLMVGTPMAERFIPKSFRQARRGNGQGGIRWERMSKNSDQWEAFVQSIWDLQWIKHKVECTRELTDALYDSCQGIAVIAVGLFEQVQLEAIRSETETFGANDFGKALEKKFFFMTRMIRALRDNDKKAIARYEDISFRILADTVQQEDMKETEEKRVPKNKDIMDLVVIQLQEMGVLPEKARKYVDEAAETMKGRLSQKDLLKEAFKLHIYAEEDKEQDNPKKEVDGDYSEMENVEEMANNNVFEEDEL